MSDDDALGPVGALSAADETTWLRLRNHVARQRGFWFGAMFAGSDRGIEELIRRAASVLAANPTARKQVVYRAAHPSDLVGAAATIASEFDDTVGLTWLVATAPLDDGRGEPTPWLDHWRSALQALNRRRDTLRKHLGGGVLLVGPPALQRLLATQTVDLWSVRTFTAELHPDVMRPGAARGARDLVAGELDANGAVPSASIDDLLLPDDVTASLRQIALQLSRGEASEALEEAAALVDRAQGDSQLAAAYGALADARAAHHYYGTAIDAARDAIQHLSVALGRDHPTTLSTRRKLAHWLGVAGRTNEAIAHFEALVDDQARVLGPDHTETLTSRHNIARRLGESGRVDEAIARHEALLGDTARLFGADHIDTLIARGNVAYWVGESGLVNHAITMHEALLADTIRVLGPGHPDALATRHNLARLVGVSGQVNDAITQYEVLLNDTIQVLGPDHQNTLTSRANLAHWMGQSGRVDDAVTQFQALLSDRIRVLGPDHPDTLTSRDNLAHWLGQSGRIEEAVTQFEALADDATRVLGADHPNTLASRHNLAFWLAVSGRADDAVPQLAALLRDRTRVLGSDNPHTLATRAELHRLWREAKQR